MPEPFFFLAFTGLGVSLAGFAGLVGALGGVTDTLARWRIRNIVWGGFGVALAALIVSPVFQITDDVENTVQFVSVFMLFHTAGTAWIDFKAWPDGRPRGLAALLNLGTVVLLGVTYVRGSVALLQVAFVVALFAPMRTFMQAVADLQRNREQDT